MHIGYLTVFSMVAAVMAFLVRDVPDEWNESNHIGVCVYAFICIGVMLIPLDMLVNDSPNGE